MVFAFFDGDDIGPTLERLLTEGRVEEARLFSQNITAAMASIGDDCRDQEGAEIILIGGDDALISLRDHSAAFAFSEGIRGTFQRHCGNTMSCGIASTIREAIWKLHEAKLFGKNVSRSGGL